MRRLVTLFVLWLTLLSAIPGVVAVSQPRTAAAQEMYHVYLPWVPFTGEANGVGPWHGKVSIRNLSDSQCAVSIWVGGTSGWVRNALLSMRGGASLTISAASLAVPRPGAPVHLEAFCPIASSVKEVTPDSRQTAWSDGAGTVTGYSGIAGVDLEAASQNGSSGWFLPIVQTNSNWNTIIRIANFHESANVTAQVKLYPSGNTLGEAGVARTIQVTIPAGDHAAIDALDELGAAEWVGYASISANGPVGVLAHRSKPSTRMALTNVAIAADGTAAQSSYRISAPLLFTAYNGWNTGINLANISSDPADVTVRYYETGGASMCEESLTIPGHSMHYLYTPGNVDQEEFVGSAVIVSDAPVIGAIDEVKYDSIDAMSYIASSVGQKSAAIPLVFRQSPAGNQNDNSGINIANLNMASEQAVEVTFLTNVGAEILPQPIIVTLPPGGSNFIYLPFIAEFPAGTVASALLRTADPLGFVAVSNDVNYAVSGDGSVVFNAVSEQGLYRLTEAPQQ